VHEGNNTYSGGCGASAPNPAQPCQISAMMFFSDMEGRPTFEGNVFCQELQNEALPTLHIELTRIGASANPFDLAGTSTCSSGTCRAPDGSPCSACTPARFAFGNCTGFRL
jgi:hypothetical protein